MERRDAAVVVSVVAKSRSHKFQAAVPVSGESYVNPCLQQLSSYFQRPPASSVEQEHQTDDPKQHEMPPKSPFQIMAQPRRYKNNKTSFEVDWE